MVEALLNELHIETVTLKPDSSKGRCAGLSFVITGKVYSFTNRDSFKAYIEDQGGAVMNSVTNKTNYLVNNDIVSESNKNKKTKELGIPIISENEFIQQFGSFNELTND